MKSFITATIFSILSVSALAAPTASVEARQTPGATIALSNDMTGGYASVTLPFGKTVYLVPELFAGTAIDINRDGSSFKASSASLVGGLSYNLICAIQSNDGGELAQKIEGQLTPQKTYLKFGDKTPEGLNRLEVVELKGAFIQCDVF